MSRHEKVRRVQSRDVLQVAQRQRTDNKLRNASLYVEMRREAEDSLPDIIEDTFRLQRAVDDRLTLALIEGSLSPSARAMVREGNVRLQENRKRIAKKINEGDTEQDSEVPTNVMAVAASRVSLLTTFDDTPDVLSEYEVMHEDSRTLYMLPRKADGLLEEAVSVLPDRNKLAGIAIEKGDKGDIVDFYFYGDENKLVKQSVDTHKFRAALDDVKRRKHILIATEGDIAGHAIRALETARGLRRLGYEPDIIGGGYYMGAFRDEDFNVLHFPGATTDVERERIIAKARGEGKGGIFFWDSKTVRNRAGVYKDMIGDYMSQHPVDLFVSDMSVIADMTTAHLQQEQGVHFPTVTQTHDIRLSPERTLRSLKVNNIPVGELLHAVNASPLVQQLDKKGRRFVLTHMLFDGLADVVMGLPLTVYDYTHRKRGGTYRRPSAKFTDYLYGRDGTIVFGLDEYNDKKQFSVGLQADRGNGAPVDSAWVPSASDTRPVVVHAQGSTYHKGAWNIVADAVTTMPGVYSVHGTGRKEDSAEPLFVGQDNDQPVGYKVGYLPGYVLSKNADVLVHHGGHGTISQWVLATADRLREEKKGLLPLLSSADDSEIASYLQQCGGVSRSVAVCNTFEQENNALALQEVGGENVCKVLIADKLARGSDPIGIMQEIVKIQLEGEITTEERRFWLDTIRKVSTMNAPIHAALRLERMMVGA